MVGTLSVVATAMGSATASASSVCGASSPA